MALPPPKLTIPSAPVASFTPESIWVIGPCWAIVMVALGVSVSFSTERSRERVVTSPGRFTPRRASSGASSAMEPRPQWMTGGFEYTKEPLKLWSY